MDTVIDIVAHIQNRYCHRWRCWRVVSFKKQKIASQAAQKMTVPIAEIIDIKNSLKVIYTEEPDKMALSYNTPKRKHHEQESSDGWQR